MIKKVFRIYADCFRPNRLSQLILFITSACNLRCQHCFYWQNLGRKGNLSFSQLKKISQSTPKFQDLLLSGGEPFLRKDLVEVVRLFWENNQIGSVNIPTNGFLTQEITVMVKEILAISPDLQVNLNLSLDGPEPVHDRIRGKKGSFQKAIKTIQTLAEISQRHSHLGVTVVTTVMKENLDELMPLMTEIEALELNRVLHYFEIIRGDPKEVKLKQGLNSKKFKEVYQKIFTYQKKKLAAYYDPGFWGKLRASIALASLVYLYRLQYQRFFNRGFWPMPCAAGRKIVVIDANGDLRACELRAPVVNLRDEDFNLSKLLTSQAWEKEKRAIRQKRCDCTHVCFLYQSMKASPKIMFYHLPLVSLRLIFKKGNLW